MTTIESNGRAGKREAGKMAADDGDVLVVFGAQPAAPAWSAVGDPVMGGRSTGALTPLDATTSVFHGEVSLANGGGFASVDRKSVV